MPSYKAPVADTLFVLKDVLGYERYNNLPGFSDASPDVLEAILAESAKLAEEIMQPSNRIGDVALAPFIRAHFGQEMVDYAVQPFVSGIYAGDPEKLSTRHAFPRLWQFEKEHGSLLRGQIAAARQRRAQGLSRLPRLLSFRRGLQALPDALAARLPSGTALLKVRVDGIVPTGPRWTVHWHDG